MKRSRLQLAAVWAISAWPLLNFISANWEELAGAGAASLLGVLVATLVIGTLGHVLQRLAARFGHGGFFVAVWLELICLFFGYTALRDLSRSAFESAGLPIPPFAGFIAVSVLVLGVTTRFRAAGKLQLAALSFCFAAAALALVMVAVAAVRFDRRSADEAAANGAGTGTNDRLRGPNVYYVILDSYPGSRGLRLSAGFDDSAFMARMAARGFVDRSTERSNYLMTAQTLGAIFALDYAQTEDPRRAGNPRLLYPRLFESAARPALVARARAAGYASWFSPSVWDECPRRSFNCLGETAFMRFDRMAQAFFAPTPFGRPLLYLLGRRHNALDTIVRDLPALTSSARPIFVFGHHNLPHPPFLFDRNCRPYADRNDVREGWGPDAHPAFLDALNCVNLQAEQFVEAVVRADPDALIVLQGDHGSAFSLDWELPISSWSAASVAERASYLNLVRAPAPCARWLDRPLGQVNTARFVIACIEGKQPVYLPERTYLSTYSTGRDHGVVREWHDQEDDPTSK
jgi:hypothetical protein